MQRQKAKKPAADIKRTKPVDTPIPKKQIHIKSLSSFRHISIDFTPERTLDSILQELSDWIGLPTSKITLFCYDADINGRVVDDPLVDEDGDAVLSDGLDQHCRASMLIANGANLVYNDLPWKRMTDFSKTLSDYGVGKSSTILMQHRLC